MMDHHYEAERLLRQQLANLEMNWRRQAEPLFKQMAHLEAMKPPRPMWLEASLWAQLDPQGFASITGKPAPAPESPGDRMHRLEDERGQLLHLLRLVRSAGPALPSFLNEKINRTLDEWAP